MLAELFRAICDKADEASAENASLKLREHPDPRKVYMTHGKHREVVDRLKPSKRFAVHRICDLFDCVANVGCDKASIWHNEDRIVAVCDTDWGTDLITYQLAFSEQFSLMPFNQESHSPRDLIRLLRVKLAGAVAGTSVTPFRGLTFTTKQQARDVSLQTEDSMGREVDSMVSGTEAIPEVLPVQLDVYQCRDIATVVILKIDVSFDYDNSAVVLEVIGGAEERNTLISLAQESIHAALLLERSERGLEVPVMYGAPGYSEQLRL